MEISQTNVSEWIDSRIKQDEIDSYLREGKDFIPHEEIVRLLTTRRNPGPKRIEEILAKSLAVETLSPDECAELLSVSDPDLFSKMKETALAVKKKVYDNRIVTFAPLYLSSACVNNCLYCGFRNANQEMPRQVLTREQIQNEVKVLAGQIGHKRLIAVYGEHPDSDIDYMVSSIQAIYDVRMQAQGHEACIRRVNVNAAPMPVAELRRLYEVGIGTYQVFQETYHRPTYERVHPKGTLKHDYRWRLYSMHRALEAGIDDVGIGALFGLYDWKFEVMGLLYHAMELERTFGIGPHTVSFPRMEPAANAPLTMNHRYEVSDEDFKKIMTVIRLAIPYAGMIITARESAEMRRQAVSLGITQTDASAKIALGAYTQRKPGQSEVEQQFVLGDTRSLEEVIGEFADMGYITSFCTAGYRCGRTGQCIMELLRSGKEGKFCKLNAVLTFREWLDDFATEPVRKACEPVIEQEIGQIREQMPHVITKFLERYERVKKGERDLYF